MKSSGWGGRRPGSGPKPKYMMSSNQVKKMLRRMRKSKRETGVDEDEFLVSIISTGKTPEGEEVDIKERLSAVKIFKDYTRSKHTEKDININHNQGPRIGLPEMRPDPAKLIPIILNKE
jgi:hypothetical protein